MNIYICLHSSYPLIKSCILLWESEEKCGTNKEVAKKIRRQLYLVLSFQVLQSAALSANGKVGRQ